MNFEKIIAQREQEILEFNAKYAHNPEKLTADLNKAIKTIEAKGYIVRTYEDREAGQVYEIMHSDHSTVYGYGTCNTEQVIRFASNICDKNNDSKNKTTDNSTKISPNYRKNQEKEKEYDLIYNEGGEGYNPYRVGSAHTYD